MKQLKLIIILLIGVVVSIFLYGSYGWTTYNSSKDGFTLNSPLSFKHFTNTLQEKGSFYEATEVWYQGDKPAESGAGGYNGEQIYLNIVSNNFDKTFNNPPSSQTNQIQISGQTTIEKIYNDNIVVGPFEHNQKIYEFSYLPPTRPSQNYRFPQHLDLFHKMLSSFKFTN